MAKEADRRTIFVGGLADDVNEDTVSAAFVPFGEIKDLHIPRDAVTKQHKGFGFVEFEDQEDATHAIENMNGAELYGKVLRVNRSKAISREQKGKAVWADADEYFKDKLKEQ
uniref:RRM domain-containing protein n=1 Tax=Palpitomonas bilix TaxID=652834 RepID=A0A7S3DE86_9EUKA|mmetsp:Transcript_3326/g.6509  ORF Transcript_3326/g.6509 Transcript_3326/m.6509 type:complete len:112 (+) Transcript_3326:56-391(+)